MRLWRVLQIAWTSILHSSRGLSLRLQCYLQAMLVPRWKLWQVMTHPRRGDSFEILIKYPYNLAIILWSLGSGRLPLSRSIVVATVDPLEQGASHFFSWLEIYK